MSASLPVRLRRIARGYEPTDYGVSTNLDEAADEIDRLTAEVARLRDFARDAICLTFDGLGDSADIQDAALRYGLIVSAKYDEDTHGTEIEAEPGDEIFVYADILKGPRAALPKEPPVGS